MSSPAQTPQEPATITPDAPNVEIPTPPDGYISKVRGSRGNKRGLWCSNTNTAITATPIVDGKVHCSICLKNLTPLVVKNGPKQGERRYPYHYGLRIA